MLSSPPTLTRTGQSRLQATAAASAAVLVAIGVLLWRFHDTNLPTGWSPEHDTGNCELFPPQAIFRQRVDDPGRFPKHPDSDRWIHAIGPTVHLHADWGEQDDPSNPKRYFGIPFNVVSAEELSSPWPQVRYMRAQQSSPPQPPIRGYPEESDCAQAVAGALPEVQRNCALLKEEVRRFPYPAAARVEGGICGNDDECGDRHVLVVEKSRCHLWESFDNRLIAGHWHASSTAQWDLTRLDLRPDGWTSADAAGLPILPLLARATEARSGRMEHALRVTFRDDVLDRAHVWPARHDAGNAIPGGIPFGALLRLKPSFSAPWWWNEQSKAVAQAMKSHGVYVADIGSDFFIQGDPSSMWSPLTRIHLRSIRLGDLEFVDMSRTTRQSGFSANSMRSPWINDAVH